MRPTVVIVDDSDGFRDFFARCWSTRTSSRSGTMDDSSAVPLILGLSAPLVLLDIRLPDISDFVVADWLAAAGHKGLVVLVSSRRVPTSAAKVAPVAGCLPTEAISGEALRRFVVPAA